MTKIFNEKGGCNEDCLHCPFPDCYKPAYNLDRKNNARVIPREVTAVSQGKRYTLELGKYGGAHPNISKSWW